MRDKYNFIQANSCHYAITRMCTVLKVSPSGYYCYANRGISKKEKEDQMLLEKIRIIHEKSKFTYGSPRIYAELQAIGEYCHIKRVQRLMKANDIKSKIIKKYKRTTNSERTKLIAPNRLAQDFSASRPNEKWVSDITYIWTKQGWCYLAVIMDLYSRMIIGMSVSKRINRDLVKRALDNAFQYRGITNANDRLLVHTDRGSQYGSYAFTKALADRGARPSMSGKGCCYDNAPMESFFQTLKLEHVYWQSFTNREEANLSIFEFIYGFYNENRRHSYLGYSTPAEHESKSSKITVH